jgi:DNA-binding XRE family transcriptional regulator
MKKHALRRLREDLGLRVPELAREVGVSRQFVYQVEKGSQPMGLPTARKVLKRFRSQCDALGIGLEELVA